MRGHAAIGHEGGRRTAARAVALEIRLPLHANMLVDLRRHAPAPILDSTSPSSDRCGTTHAGRHLAGRGRDIVVVESGGLDLTRDQKLADGPDLGDAYYPLVHSRLSFFGGTTNVWGGRCARLEAIDFAPRDWVPLSGSPFALDEIERWYAAAASDVELRSDAAGPPGGQRSCRALRHRPRAS